jgi:hypothetical protein
MWGKKIRARFVLGWVMVREVVQIGPVAPAGVGIEYVSKKIK